MTLALDGSAHGNNAAGVSATATLSTASAGDIICVLVVSNGNGVSSVTSSHLTFARRSQCSLASGPHGAQTEELWWAYASSALTSEVITVTQANSDFLTIDALGVSSTIGFNSSNPFDSNGSLPAVSPSVNADVILSTTATNAFIIFGYRLRSDSSASAGSGFTTVHSGDYHHVEYKIVSSPQTNLDGTYSGASGGQNGGVGDAIVESGGTTQNITFSLASLKFNGAALGTNAKSQIVTSQATLKFSGRTLGTNGKTSVSISQAILKYSAAALPVNARIALNVAAARVIWAATSLGVNARSGLAFAVASLSWVGRPLTVMATLTIAFTTATIRFTGGLLMPAGAALSKRLVGIVMHVIGL